MAHATIVESSLATVKRLRDCVRPPVRVLFVGINPGVRSAAIGHHFAGHSNRFWRLLFESGLVTEPIGAQDDHRLPERGLGLTNLVARATTGIDALRGDDYTRGLLVLRRKIERWHPDAVALVGVTLFRVITGSQGRITLGLQAEPLDGAELFVLPNPSGRNANYSHDEMLESFRSVARWLASSTPDARRRSQAKPRRTRSRRPSSRRSR